jgi:DNA-directed RNA polymerase II subunit RPB1
MVQSMSVCEISKQNIYDDSRQPEFNGINDPRMGTMDKNLHCFTCRGSDKECPGHFGHISLVKPVYHYGFIQFTLKILRCVCFNCYKLLNVEDKDHYEFQAITNVKTRFNSVFRACDS